ncbi:uncharacterized protein LOC142994057 [Genypterus blacodes]|uniref:uncharacterized protein LOC142994057 n=1 Tax=Genypterus blacodes TaxID=154954 RepID=UPI003F7573DA
MYLFGIFLLFRLSGAFPVPMDTVVIQVQQQGVVGGQRVVEQVLFNGVPLSDMSQEVENIIQTMSASALLNSINQTAVMKNHTVLRSRECILEGSRLHCSDRVFYDKKVYLTLEQTDTWTAHIPQALDIKPLWDKEVEHTGKGSRHLQEGCLRLMRELRLSEEQSVPGIPSPHFLIPMLALLAFTGLGTISLLIAKKHGLQVPGGVIGSIVHYPPYMTEMPPEKKGSGYQTL